MCLQWTGHVSAEPRRWKSEALVPLDVGSSWQRRQAILGGVEILMKRALGSHKGIVCSESARRWGGSSFPPVRWEAWSWCPVKVIWLPFPWWEQPADECLVTQSLYWIGPSRSFHLAWGWGWLGFQPLASRDWWTNCRAGDWTWGLVMEWGLETQRMSG